MKKYLFGLLVVSLLLSGPLFSQDANTDPKTQDNKETTETADPANNTGEVKEGEEKEGEETKSLVPDSVAMDLAMSDQEYVMPANFRGGDPDKTVVHVLEDVYYKKQEHCLIYGDDASNDVASGSNFESEPNITWTTSKKDDTGKYVEKEADNNNVGTHGGYLHEPGDYHIGNSGAREVSEPTEEVKDVNDPKETEDKKKKTVTSSQTLGVIVHDCTSPDVWVAFQEGAGTVDMAASQEELKQKVFEKIKATEARPFSTNAKDYENESYLFVDEGIISNDKKENERDKEPWNKTARISIAGALFNKDNISEFKSGVIKSSLMSKDDQTRLVHVSNKSDEKTLTGIYIRRNVPFVFAAVSIDNGNDRVAPTEIDARIEKVENNVTTVVEKSDNSYMFRIANYPRASYKDQPEYFFVAKATDEGGNITTIRLPIYVLNSSATFETSANN
ncbi:MAG: hypothetical protein IKP71_01565 [Candidatus Riflebacteria bacterium]|nr:hypothetical protein [Candidatus Riflebacteria bacterium]